MATYTYFDFTLRVSFPKAGMHTLQKGSRGVSVSRDDARLIRDYYMKNGNDACKRLLSESTVMGVVEAVTKKTGLQALYILCDALYTKNEITAETVIDFLKSLSGSLGLFNPFPLSIWDVGDIVIAALNYKYICDIYNEN